MYVDDLKRKSLYCIASQYIPLYKKRFLCVKFPFCVRILHLPTNIVCKIIIHSGKIDIHTARAELALCMLIIGMTEKTFTVKRQGAFLKTRW